MKLLNTLYVQTQGAYLSLDHGAVKVEADGETLLRVPLHHLDGITAFGNVLFSPYLLHECAEDGRTVAWFTRSGRFRGRLSGPETGNVLLRQAQHSAHRSAGEKFRLARTTVEAKLKNTLTVVRRAIRDRNETGELEQTAERFDDALRSLEGAEDTEELRGIEGSAASAYFGSFEDMIVAEDFSFERRTRRPPRDRVNALLSFSYAILTNDCAAAAEGVGLDPQIGFLHETRPGRPSLGLDLVEEFRAWLADRLVLALLNRSQVRMEHFEERPGGAVSLNEEGREEVLTALQERKQDEITHPVLDREVPVGLLPNVQARMLARYLRGDTDEYVPFRGS